MVWKNGQIPAGDLVVFNDGWDDDGYWYWALSPATLARHNALVARAKKRTGRTLTPGRGYSTYRPLEPQRKARARYGNGAAVVGTSSHGGFWENQETLAIDYDNWAWVYEEHGGRAAFYEDCRAVGLTPGMIEPRRGYPDEPWHVIDLNPRGPVPAFEDSQPFEEDDMFTEEDRNRQKNIENLLKYPGADYGRPEVTEQKVDALAAAVSRVESGLIFYPGASYYMAPALANVVREDNDLPPVLQVTEESVVKAIVPLVPNHVGALADADLERIIAAASAEQAERRARAAS